ncbi:MAG: trypsin-like peptidase domain-containing protein [Patescibacteria group bacterium]|nr:trypsin-like peptidase domain-containing protein [Patescibacteria group bacterium]
MTRKIGLFTIAALAIIAAGLYGVKGYSGWQQEIFDGRIAALQKQVSQLGEEVAKLSGQPQAASLPAAEVQTREIIREKSQDDLLTAAVAKAAPAVVSIVISKDVPQLEVVYQNPFGDDPFFKDFNIQVPVYQQKGTTYQKVGAGTGFLITADGYILTNKHVVSDDSADYTALTSDGKQYAAKVVYKDASNDIAVLKIEGSGFATVGFGDSASLKLGQTVAAIGNALGEYNNSVSTGIISGLDRTISATSSDGSVETLSGVIQTDAAINPGNSGGPLLDLQGHVVGVNVATVTGSNSISFSIPINVVKPIIRSAIGQSL